MSIMAGPTYEDDYGGFKVRLLPKGILCEPTIEILSRMLPQFKNLIIFCCLPAIFRPSTILDFSFF